MLGWLKGLEGIVYITIGSVLCDYVLAIG
jgi:hypothetical protein